MIGTISLIITLVVLLLIVCSSLFGLLRGWKRTLVKLGRTVCAIALAFGAAKLIETLLPMESIFDAILFPIFQGNPMLSDLFTASPTLHAFISYLPAALVTPTLFIILFCLIDLLLLIPSYFVRKAINKSDAKKAETEQNPAEPALESVIAENYTAATVVEIPADPNSAQATADPYTAINDTANEAQPKKKKNEKHKKIKLTWGERLGGVGIKIANSLVVMMVFMLPISCLIHTVNDGLYEIRDAMEDADAEFTLVENSDPENPGSTYTVNAENLTVLFEEYISPLASNPVIAMSANPLSRAMYANLTEVKLHGESAFLDDELRRLFTLVSDFTYFFIDTDEYGEAQKTAMNDIIGYVSHSHYKAAIASELLAEMADSWQRGEDFMGIEKPSEESAEIIVEPLLDILSRSTPEAVETDLTTFANILGILIDYDLQITIMDSLETGDSIPLIEHVANSEMLSYILEEIYENEDYRVMIQPVIKVFFRSVLSGFIPEASIHISDTPPHMTSELMKEEGVAISAMILNVLDFVQSMPEDQSEMSALELIIHIDVTSLGAFYDNSQHSLLFREGIKETFVAILGSSMLDGISGVGTILIDHIENDADLNMLNLLTSTQELAKIFNTYESGNGTTNMSDLTKSLNLLINSVDGSTSEIINEMIQSGAFGSTVVDSSKNDKVTQMLSTVITSMSEMEDLTEEELEKEAKAIDYMMKIANTASSGDSSDSETITNIFAGEEDSAEDMVDTMLSSKLASDAINALAYDENGNLNEDALEISQKVNEEEKDSIIASVEKYYKQTAEEKGEEQDDEALKEELETLKTNINAIAAIFGENLSEDFDAWDAEIFG